MRLALKIYAGLFSALFAIIFVAQLLGFFGLYQPILAIPATIFTTVLAYWGYQKWQFELQPEEKPSRLLLFSSLMLVGLVFLLRMMLWPHSELGTVIPADFFGYHAIKALELARSASMWNLAIPYGDYPNGYESIIAFGLLFTGDIRITGTIHALIFLLLWLSLTLLLVRYAKIPFSIALFLVTMLSFLPPFYSLLLTIGKNDVLLSLTVLMAILHAPLPGRNFHPLGLAFATMLSLAIKASGLYILFYLWGLVLLFWGMAWREGKAKSYFHPLVFMICLGIMFIGGLWVIRNYWLMREVLTSEVRSFFITSIGANLANPLLYNSGEESRYLIASAVLILLAVIFCFKKFGWTTSLLLLIVAVTFVFTPLSAFHTLQSEVLHIEWRYIFHGSLLLSILFLTIIWPLFAAKTKYLPVLSLMATIGLILVLKPQELLSYNANRSEIFIAPRVSLRNLYEEASKLEEGILYIENADWFMLSYFNPQLTITEGNRYPLGRADIYPPPVPDYALFIPKRNLSEPTFRDLAESYEWEIIYQDEDGRRLYRRLP